MRFKKKQWVSILLLFTMLFTIMPVGAFAETGTDEETVLSKEEYVSVTYYEAPAVSLFALDSNGSIALKDGQYEQWIDRLDLTGNDYAKDFYSWMETTDTVITPESAEQLASGEYVHRVTSFSGTGSFAYTGEYEKDVAAIEEATREELDVHMVEAFAYIDAAFSAFCRDHAEVFWLNNTIKVISECSYAYDSTGAVEYTQDIYFVLKSADFDIRAEEYRSAENIQSAIEQRDAAVDEITAAASGSRYEKVAYFNEWLTTHNSYNSNVATAGRAAHECISALSGSTGANGPVCEGYASAMKVLCDAVGIPCVLVDGIANDMSGNTEGHMWNCVQMENGKWYAVDVTWNDPFTGSSAAVSGAEHTGYLLVGSETVVNDNGMTFADTHTILNTVTNNGTAFTNGPVLENGAYEYDANAGENEDNSNIVASGTCGDNVTWTLDTNGLLTISGTGDMANYREDMVTVPWLDYKADIKKVIVENGVTSIGDYAFEGCSNLAEITLPTGITAIGDYAFKNCDALVDITIPEGVTRLGDHAFADADGLKELILPASVSNIGTNAFYSCTNLETVIAEGNLNAISNLAFSWCSNLKKVSIAGTIAGIGERAFWDCNSLEEVSAKTITGEIQYGAFEGCSALQRINASLDGLTAIGSSAFMDCISLTEILLPEGLERIDAYAFNHCGLEEIIIPDSVTRIGGHVFESCYKLKNAVLPAELLAAYNDAGIPNSIFYDCPYLKTVTISNDMTERIEENAFGKCSGLTDIYFAGSPNQWNCITVEAGNEALTSNKLTVHCQASDDEILMEGTYGESVGQPVKWTLTRGGTLTFSGTGPVLLYVAEDAGHIVKTLVIEDGITAIQDYDAYYYNNLETLYLSDSVMSIDYSTFVDCKKLEDVYYAGSPTQWECLAPEISDSVTIHCEKSDDEILASGTWGTNGTWQLTCGGVLDIFGSNETIDGSQDWYSYAEFITTVKIYDGVTGINETLNNCVHLKNVHIPDSVVYIYSSFDGFYGCPVTDVYYAGSPEEWSKVDCRISTISNATIHYGREQAPVQQLEPAFSAFLAIDGDQKTKVNLPVEFVLEAFDTEGSYMEKGTDILVWAETSGGVVTSAMTVKRDGINVSKSNQFANVYLLTDAMHDEVFEISFSRTGAYTVYAGILTENRPAFEEIQKLSCDGYSEIKVTTDATEETIEAIAMHRLYNPNSGEHFYTGSIEERDMLVSVGWQYEGIAWNAPANTGNPVYRLFNPNNGDHHYTMSAEERDMLVSVGWKYEGVCWNSAGNDGIPLYRLYNPNADCGSHHYTGSTEERDFLVSLGWHFEGIGWFGIR